MDVGIDVITVQPDTIGEGSERLLAVAGKERRETLLVGGLHLLGLGGCVARQDPCRVADAGEEPAHEQHGEEVAHPRPASLGSPTFRSSSGRFRSWLSSRLSSWFSRVMRPIADWIRICWNRVSTKAQNMPITNATNTTMINGCRV